MFVETLERSGRTGSNISHIVRMHALSKYHDMSVSGLFPWGEPN